MFRTASIQMINYMATKGSESVTLWNIMGLEYTRIPFAPSGGYQGCKNVHCAPVVVDPDVNVLYSQGVQSPDLVFTCELVFRVSKERVGNIPRKLSVSGRGAGKMELVVVLAWTWG